MITLEPTGHVRSSRTDLSDDNWTSSQAGQGRQLPEKT
jgi:hypothetical protein